MAASLMSQEFEKHLPEGPERQRFARRGPDEVHDQQGWVKDVPLVRNALRRGGGMAGGQVVGPRSRPITRVAEYGTAEAIPQRNVPLPEGPLASEEIL